MTGLRLRRIGHLGRTGGLIAAGGACLLLLACGGGEEASKPASKPAAATKAPAAAAPDIQQISADGRRCIELVKAKSYAAAIDPCQRAMDGTANADVERAYATAQAEVEKAAKAAATQAARDALSGKPTDEAAKDALKGFGK